MKWIFGFSNIFSRTPEANISPVEWDIGKMKNYRQSVCECGCVCVYLCGWGSSGDLATGTEERPLLWEEYRMDPGSGNPTLQH